MDKKELKKRLKQLAINTTKLCMQLSFSPANKIYTGQVIRSSSSSAAINTVNSNLLKEDSKKIRNPKSKI